MVDVFGSDSGDRKFSPVKNSVIGNLKDVPGVQSDVAKRMALRLVPYLFPTQLGDLEVVGEVRPLRVLHRALLGSFPNLFVNDQQVLAIGNEREYFDTQNIYRSESADGGSLNPCWLAENAVETAVGLVLAWVMVTKNQWQAHQMTVGILRMESIYLSAPSDISEGHGELFSTLPENLGRDANVASQSGDVWELRLFEHGQINSEAGKYWSAFKKFSDNHSHWSFWRDWYQGFLDGKPLDWELQRRVALIPDADWEQGPEHIAEVIEKIRLEFRTSVAPRLVRNVSDDAFHVEQEDALTGDVLEFSRDRIKGALQNALESSGENGLRADSYETVAIQRALDHHSGRASLLATGFFDACLSFQKTIGDRYPDDAALINLQNALYAVVEEINEQNEEARKRCARLASLAKPGLVTRADREDIALVPEQVAGELDREANVILQSDVELILSQEYPPKSVRARFTNWVTTISMWMDKAKKGDQRAQWLAGVVSRLVRWWIGKDDDDSSE